MPRHDVLIVGGGPSGSTLAWALKQQGMDVAIIDKQHFPRDKVCAGWIPPAVLTSLQIDIDDYSQQNILQPIHGFRIGRMSGNFNDIEYRDEPVSYAIRRCEFDNYLLNRSKATVYADTKVTSFHYADDTWTLNDTYSAPLLIGAGGHFCPVARHIGAKLGKSEVAVTAQEIEFEMNASQQQACQVTSDKPELYFCDDLKGYGWVVRKQNYLNIGLGREDNNRLSEHVSKFCDMLKQQGRIPEDIPSKFHGHAYLCYSQARRPLLDNGVMLIGDAAGLAYGESGEGIRPAIESALLAAQVIQENHAPYSKESISAYVQQMEERFGKRLHNAVVSENPLLSLIKTSLGNTLLNTRWFDKYVVMNRWFLHRQQAPLVLQATAN